MRRDPQVDALSSDRGFHGPEADERARPDLAEFDHAQCGFMRAELTGQDEHG
jgi:hypothetical protein